MAQWVKQIEIARFSEPLNFTEPQIVNTFEKNIFFAERNVSPIYFIRETHAFSAKLPQ